MIFDWIFIVLLLAIFIVILILSVIVLNSAEDIPASLRNRDSELEDTYNNLLIAGYIGLSVGIVGICFTFMAILFLIIPPLTRLLDYIPKVVKIIIKTLYGFASAGLTIYAGFLMAEAAIYIDNSRTYRKSIRSAKASLKSAIDSSILASNILYGMGSAIIVLFILICIYDIFKDYNTKKAPEFPYEDADSEIPYVDDDYEIPYVDDDYDDIII